MKYVKHYLFSCNSGPKEATMETPPNTLTLLGSFVALTTIHNCPARLAGIFGERLTTVDKAFKEFLDEPLSYTTWVRGVVHHLPAPPSEVTPTLLKRLRPLIWEENGWPERRRIASLLGHISRSWGVHPFVHPDGVDEVNIILCFGHPGYGGNEGEVFLLESEINDGKHEFHLHLRPFLDVWRPGEYVLLVTALG